MRKYGFKKKVQKSVKKTYKRTRRSPTVSTVKKMVKSEIARNVENKRAQYYKASQIIYNVLSASFQNSIFPVSPYSTYLQVDQGTSQGNRIGNQIKIKSLYFKGMIHPLPYNAITNEFPRPVEITMWLFYKRDTPNAIPTVGSDFLQIGGSSRALFGTIQDAMAPVNNDAYRVLYKRTFKVGTSNYSSEGVVTASQGFANNDYKYNQKFSINLKPYLIENVKYDDNNSTPKVRGLFCMFESNYADGTISGSGTQTSNVTYTLDMVYEDA